MLPLGRCLRRRSCREQHLPKRSVIITLSTTNYNQHTRSQSTRTPKIPLRSRRFTIYTHSSQRLAATVSACKLPPINARLLNLLRLHLHEHASSQQTEYFTTQPMHNISSTAYPAYTYPPLTIPLTLLRTPSAQQPTPQPDAYFTTQPVHNNNTESLSTHIPHPAYTHLL